MKSFLAAFLTVAPDAQAVNQCWIRLDCELEVDGIGIYGYRFSSEAHIAKKSTNVVNKNWNHSVGISLELN